MGLHLADYAFQLVGVAIIAAVFHSSYSIVTNPTSKVPGPWYTKFTDLAARYHYFKGEAAYYVHSMHQNMVRTIVCPAVFGPFVRVGPNEVVVADLDAVKTIYSVKETFRKSIFYEHMVAQPVASVFSTADVDDHRRLRRLMASQMSESNLKWLTPTVLSRAELTIQRMKQEMKTRGLIDVFKWGLFMTTDVIGELSFGESFHMLEKGEKNQYISDLENLGAFGAIQITFPTLFALAQKYPLPIFRQTVQQAARALKYARQSLQRYQSHLEENPTKPKQTFFTKMFAVMNEKISFQEILVNASAFIVAGSDTTANTMAYLLWSICQRPDIRDALVKEIQTLPEDFTEPDLRELPFLNQCIDETLRLYSAAPSSLPRVVPPGGAQLGDYWLPEGATVSTQAYTLHRDPDVFPNPLQFDPHRWEAPTKVMKETFMPFGRGPRVCIGLHLAYIELRILTVRFFQEFPTAFVSSREGFSDDDMAQAVYFLLSAKGKRCLIEAY